MALRCPRWSNPGSIRPHPPLLLLTCGTHGQVVRVIPPLVTTKAEIDQAIAIIAESLAALS